LQIVFLSCVSAQFKDLRIRIAAQNSTVYRILIQEDFDAISSPYGTLVKIYEQLKTVDLVLHLIGAMPSAQVSSIQVEELLRHDPLLRPWLSRSGLLTNALAGRLGYGHVEAYLAIYLRIPLVPVFFQNGTQPEHVNRLRRIGRHVEKSVSSIEELSAIISEGIGRAREREVAERHDAYARSFKTRLLAWGGAVLVLLALSFLMNLEVTVLEASNPLPFGKSVVLWLVSVAVYCFVVLAAISSELTFAFRAGIAVRTGIVFFFVISVVAFLCAILDKHEWYWPIIVMGGVLLGAHTRSQTASLEGELEYWRGSRTGEKVTHDHFYWTRRDSVFAALQVLDFDSEPPKAIR
jgi:ABC-type multidrug transport system fused ATPase/permease subunit